MEDGVTISFHAIAEDVMGDGLSYIKPKERMCFVIMGI